MPQSARHLNSIRNQVVAETKSDEFLVVLASERVSVNVYLRQLHNFALDMNWLLALAWMFVTASITERNFST